MNLAGLLTGGVIEAVGKVADDLITSDEERANAALESKRIDAQAIMGVHETNKAEAANASVFVAGWRPYIGWVCGTALALVYIPKAIVMSAIWSYAAIVLVAQWQGIGSFPALPPYPDLGVTDLIGLVVAMLGMAGLRTTETMAGVARSAPLTNPFKRKPAPEQEAP